MQLPTTLDVERGTPDGSIGTQADCSSSDASSVHDGHIRLHSAADEVHGDLAQECAHEENAEVEAEEDLRCGGEGQPDVERGAAQEPILECNAVVEAETGVSKRNDVESCGGDGQASTDWAGVVVSPLIGADRSSEVSATEDAI